MSRWSWILSEWASRLWMRASLYGIAGLVTALAAIYFKRFIPEDLPQKIGADAVDGILNIMAASMLSVTIFSLSTMVSAYGAATSNVTPRATRLLIEDRISHRALSTFIGAFIFSIVGIIALKTGAYGDTGRLILFVVTIGVIVMIIVALLSWIEYLQRLGRVGHTIARVEEAAAQALEARLRLPYLGGQALNDDTKLPKGAVPIYADIVGYVQYVDMERLSHIAEREQATIHVLAPPGKFINAACPLAMAVPIKDEDSLNDIRKAFITGEERLFRQDPRFGLAVLGEIGTRALSSAINDSGTPIHIIGIGVRIFSLWAKRDEIAGPDAGILYPRVHVPPLKIDDLFDDFFTPIARDGAGLLEVMIRLQKAFAALAGTGDKDLARAARHHARLSLKRCEIALPLPEDRKRLAAIAAPLVSGAP